MIDFPAKAELILHFLIQEFLSDFFSSSEPLETFISERLQTKNKFRSKIHKSFFKSWKLKKKFRSCIDIKLAVAEDAFDES